MKVVYKDIEHSFPSSLAEITLGKRIEFYATHGKAIDDMATALAQVTNDFDKEMETNAWHLELAARTFSFYTGIDLQEVKNDIGIAQLLSVYGDEMKALFDEEQSIHPHREYEWRDERWILEVPELTPASNMTLNEFIHAKEISRQLHAIGKNKWDILPYICATYLRREGEPFQEAFIAENSERYKLMLELPLDIAISVGFFLSSTLNIYTTTSAFSRKENQRASAPPATSTGGDGFHS